eukprot:4449727-Amphidinium_carterae.1
MQYNNVTYLGEFDALLVLATWPRQDANAPIDIFHGALALRQKSLKWKLSLCIYGFITARASHFLQMWLQFSWDFQKFSTKVGVILGN